MMKKSILTRSISILLALGSLSVSTIVFAENKIALVIGNAKYKDMPLKNPVNDAADMRKALEDVGFKVIFTTNANHATMEEYRDKFIDALKALKGQGTGLFYYAGHGVQADGINYLIPTDAKIKTKSDLNERAYSLNLILGAMEDSENKMNLVILDACRTNPYRSFSRDAKEGLANTNAPKASKGSLIAYSTAANSVAADGIERNSPYTKYLKKYLFEKGATIESALKRVAEAVIDENDEQEPFYYSSIRGEFCLAGCTTTTPAPVVSTAYAPLVSFVSGADTANQNKTYTVKFKATDQDGDLSKILVDWGDDSIVTSKPATNGATLTFTHTYAYSGIYDLIATAIDKKDTESEAVSKSVTVKETVVTPPKPVVPAVTVPNISNINVSPSSIVIGNSVTFSAKLNANLPSGYNVKIDYGNGLESMNGSGKNFSLNVTPADLGSSLYSVGIYDSKNNLKSNQLTGNFSVSEPAPVVIETPKPATSTTTKGDIETFVSGDKTFSYTKIANDGSELPKTAKLGTGAKDWACTKDNNTGLIWEVKTTDGGLRDKDWRYSWYNPDSNTNGGFEGYKNKYPNNCKGSECDTYAYTNAVNQQGLCGKKDWRMPSEDEMQGLLTQNSEKNQPLNNNLYINSKYFPNTNYHYWSSSPYAGNSNGAWYVYFGYGYSSDYNEGSSYYVRLVRG